MVTSCRQIAAATLALAASALGLFAATSAAHAGARAPVCAPAVLDRSARLDGAVTVSPTPGATDATPQTQISFLGVPARDLSGISVIGAESGHHRGSLRAYSSGDGGSFVLARPFAPGEHVSVAAALTLAAGPRQLRFGFTVAEPDALEERPESLHHAAPGAQQQFRSRPDLQPPIVTVHRHAAAAASDDIFIAPYGIPAQSGPAILGPDGELVWFHPLSGPTVAANLRVQALGGAPVLTWWQGVIDNHGFGLGVDEIIDRNYEPVAVIRAGNGLSADLHEFQITPAGTALVSAYYPIRCDLAGVGGGADSAVTDSLFQEIDVKTGLVMFQWTALDHVPLRATYSQPRRASRSWPLDYFHLNSINLDQDGSLLVSSRNTWAAYDIDAVSGRLRWTLGGKRSSFVEEPGARTIYQHDARALGNDTYSVFDNGASPQYRSESRGVVLAVDPRAGTVRPLQQFVHPGRGLLADSQGNLQALPDGHWFIGWGQEPDVSEFSAHGALLFDASLPAGYESYRALRFSWTGMPPTRPALVLAGATGAETAYVSWNGATAVARWQLLQGQTSQTLTPVATVARQTFETAIPLSGAAAGSFVAVQALDAQGTVLATSAVMALADPRGFRARAAANVARLRPRRRRSRGAA
jgi:hypothetical protein